MRPLIYTALLSCSAALLQAQLEPRDHPADYPYACSFEEGAVSVDYLRRSLPTPRGTQVIPGILIFELGVYPEAGKTIDLGLNDFELDWKKAQRVQGPVHPQYVVASLMRPEYSGRGGLIAEAGTIDARTGEYGGVRIGGPPRNPRFPGDPRYERRMPEQVPSDPRLQKSRPHSDSLPSRIVPSHALSSEPIDHPSGGYIYFAYNGKLTKLKQLTLTIRQGEQTCRLLIRK